jgi:hypothetical protein
MRISQVGGLVIGFLAVTVLVSAPGCSSPAVPAGTPARRGNVVATQTCWRKCSEIKQQQQQELSQLWFREFRPGAVEQVLQKTAARLHEVDTGDVDPVVIDHLNRMIAGLDTMGGLLGSRGHVALIDELTPSSGSALGLSVSREKSGAGTELRRALEATQAELSRSEQETIQSVGRPCPSARARTVSRPSRSSPYPHRDGLAQHRPELPGERAGDLDHGAAPFWRHGPGRGVASTVFRPRPVVVRDMVRASLRGSVGARAVPERRTQGGLFRRGGRVCLVFGMGDRGDEQGEAQAADETDGLAGRAGDGSLQGGLFHATSPFDGQERSCRARLPGRNQVGDGSCWRHAGRQGHAVARK